MFVVKFVSTFCPNSQFWNQQNVIIFYNRFKDYYTNLLFNLLYRTEDCMAVGATTMAQSKENIEGKVLRVAVLHVIFLQNY